MWICVCLIVATGAVYGHVITFEFVNLDDQTYVVQNSPVRMGLTPNGAWWALSTGHASNWHPLTWLSHMLDCDLYGLDPAGHHVTNVLLHMLNTLLLFGMLQAMTATPGPSAFVAAVFALHPLHVESVAWVAERKDVLSTMFGFLCLAAYIAYARRGSIGWYLLVILLLVAGLMAKPMLVTWPLVLLLLDIWPLERFGVPLPKGGGEKTQNNTPQKPAFPPQPVGRLLVEKLPLLLLCLAASAITFMLQKATAVAPMDKIAIGQRIANATVSYVRYMGKMVWPSDLCLLYPHPNYAGGTPLGTEQVGGAVAILIGLSIAMGLRFKQHRYGLVGWLFFLVTLIPVIGLVQVGFQAMADRYTYVPLVGLIIIITWTMTELAVKRPAITPALKVAALTVLIALMCATWRQSRYWQNAVDLAQHAIDVTSANWFMNYDLGQALQKRDEFDEAIEHYREAIQIWPKFAICHSYLGFALYLKDKERHEEALKHLRLAEQLNPSHAEVQSKLSMMLLIQRELQDSIKHARKAIQVDSRHAPGYLVLGDALLLQNNPNEAIKNYRQALQYTPDHTETHRKLGLTLALLHRFEQALEHLQIATRSLPDAPKLLNTTAWILATHPRDHVRRPSEAIELAKRAVALTNENNTGFLDTLAAAYAAAGQFDSAVATAQTALDLAVKNKEEVGAKIIRERLELFEQSKPFLETLEH